MKLFQKEASKIKYLFQEDSFPIVEFIASPDESLNIPSFILDTAWPRVVYIYYPNRADYQYFQNDYVQIARRIRSESDILVLFYAISCAAHSSMCVNSDLIHTTNRPILKAYESGSSDGTEILIQSPVSTIENANNILHQLCDTLSIGDIAEFHNGKPQIQYQRGNHLPNNTKRNQPMHQNIVRGIETSTKEKQLQDTFIDAQKALILTLEYNVYDDYFNNENNDGSSANKYITNRKADILRDFLDLCYWTLPPDWKVQEVILALRTDFKSISKDRQYLPSVLSSVHDLRLQKWSESCVLSPDGNEIVNGIDKASYSCAMWKLLHIIGIGATESNSHVMGDTERTKPTYITWVIRDFIAEFFPDDQNHGYLGHMLKWCNGCRQAVVNSYDSCKEDILCFHNDHISIDVLTKESYISISKWLWDVHRKVMPTEKMKPRNKKFIYDEVKMDHWPSKLKIVRVSVLSRFKRKLPNNIKKSTKTAREQSALFLDIAMVTVIFVCLLLSRRLKRHIGIRRKEK